MTRTWHGLDEGTQAAADAANAEDAEALSSAIEETAPTIETAQAALPEGDTDAFVGSVIADLLTTAGHEYEEAVVDGELELLVEYQDAYAFMTVARSLYDTIAPSVEAGGRRGGRGDRGGVRHARRGAARARSRPRRSPTPRTSRPPPRSIAHELEETVGALVPETSDAAEIWANIDALLDRHPDRVRGR